jgi:hypothetical protein
VKSPGAICRRAVRDLLANEASGWNALIPAISNTYGAPVLPLDFREESESVEHSLRNVDDFEASLVGPLRLAIGVQESVEVSGGGTMRMFSGLVTVVLQFLYEQRVADPEDPGFDSMIEISEYVADAIEDCCLQVLCDPATIYPDVTPARQFQCVRGITEALPDGIRKGVLIQLQFGVDL